MSLPNDIKNETKYERCRRLFYTILSISPHINPCPSCPYLDCKARNLNKVDNTPRDKEVTGPNIIVGCSRWP